WRNDVVTEQLRIAESSIDPAVRLKAARDVEAAFLRELPVLSFYFRPAVVVARVGVEGLTPTGTLTPMAVHAPQWRVTTPTTSTTSTTTRAP
ncbi:MAG TPA: hypothetical protein VGF99_17705, partial [Myxococcota bacterium]